MATKMLNNFEEPSFALVQVQLLYMDSQSGGSPMSLQLACMFAEKYLTNYKSEAPPTYFSNLWLKLLHAKKDFKKALEYLAPEDRFSLWIERSIWLVRTYHAMGDKTATLAELEKIIRRNYSMEGGEF